MSSDVDLDRALEVALRVARQAGEILRDGRQRGFRVSFKGEVDLVTDVDRLSEALVVQALSDAFPDHTVVAEEGTSAGEPHAGRPIWYVDPLDGTTNYAHRLPWYAVSIGLELDGEPLVGVVRVPEFDWDFWAVCGRGAHLGQTRLSVSDVPLLDRALLATGFPYDRRTSPDNNLPEFGAVLRRCQGVRRIGAASLDCALVAWGCYDAYWEFKLKPWDICAGALLVSEAGGQVTLTDGSTFSSTAGSIIATNGLVHDELLGILAQVQQRPRDA